MGNEVARIEGGDWRELDFREDSWHSVWLAWECRLNVVAVVMAEMVTLVEDYEDMEVTTTQEVVRAAMIPPKEAMEAFIHPHVYLEWYGR